MKNLFLLFWVCAVGQFYNRRSQHKRREKKRTRIHKSKNTLSVFHVFLENVCKVKKCLKVCMKSDASKSRHHIHTHPWFRVLRKVFIVINSRLFFFFTFTKLLTDSVLVFLGLKKKKACQKERQDCQNQGHGRRRKKTKSCMFTMCCRPFWMKLQSSDLFHVSH